MAARQPILFAQREQEQISPAPQSPEPAVWVSRLLVLKSWAPDQELCDIPLQRGLNVIWAQAHVPETVAEGQSGLSGHAAGKSTLCRFIRYALGEDTFGTKDFRNAFRDRFPNGWMMAEVSVGGQQWLVRRPLGIGAHPQAAAGAAVDRAFETDTAWVCFDEYLQALNEATVTPLGIREFPTSGKRIGWNMLLGWLSRDQDCRMGHLADWRITTSDSGAPEITRTEAYWLVKVVLGLVTKADLDAAIKHEQLRKAHQRLRERIPLSQHHLRLSTDRLPKVLELADHRTDTNAELPTELELDGLRQAIQRKLDSLPPQGETSPPSPEMAEAEGVRKKARREADRLAEDLRREKNHLQRDEHLLQEWQGKKRKADAEQWERKRPAPNDRCNQLLSVARAEGCPLAQGVPVDFESEHLLKELPRRIEAMERGIAQLKEYMDNLEQAVLEAQRAADRAEQEYQRIHRQWAERNMKTATKRANLAHAMETVIYCSKLSAEISADKQQLAKMAVDLRSSSERRSEGQKRAQRQRLAFQSRFCSTVQSVLGTDTMGTIETTSEAIIARLECDGTERDSAAIETAKICAFDIAALLFAVEGHCRHPRFLIHDSPREADLSIDVYHRFFLLMKRAHESCGDSPNFQYIVTTTEKPPEALRKQPWLRAHLDAAHQEKRLLGVNI